MLNMEEIDPTSPVVENCPDCSQAIDVSTLSPFTEIVCPQCNASVRVRTTMGPYHLVGILGEGGMSQVFKAVDLHLQREVALKVLHQSLSLDSTLTAMFEREAKLTASILHPNVVKVYTVGRDQGYFFIAMEIIDALSLEQLIVDKGCLSEKEVLNIAHDVTSGLKAAYEEGLIHRDIKPGNMLVMEDGTAKLVDFGLAVNQDAEDELEELWATPFYVPPEKLDGDADTHLGDIYSLGATLYHAISGHPPFEANTSSMDELKEIKKQSLNLKGEAPSLSKATLRLIEKMMAYRPAERLASYDEILEKIEEIAEKQFGASPRSRVSKSDGTKPKLIFAGVLGLVVIVWALVASRGEKEDGLNEGLGISAEERVISAGDNSNTIKFLEGRDWVVAGNFRKAEPIFDELADETGMASATRMWSLYFQGLSRLFLGKLDDSRESFAYLAAVPDAEGPEMDEIRDFMEVAARAFSSSLPIVDGSELFAGHPLEGLGLFTAGVKNWQHGQFASGLRLLRAYGEREVPTEFSWIGELKEAVGPFRSDWEILKDLPNPSRKNEGQLSADRKTLESYLGKFQSKGAADKLLKSRLARVEAIQEMVRMEKAEPRPAVDAPTEGESHRMSKAERNEQEEKDLTLLRDLLGGFDESLAPLQFEELVSQIVAADVSTSKGFAWQEELADGFGKATEFVDLLSREFGSKGYTGIVHRREGVPLDVMITGATPTFFTLDLGFGPNEVPVEYFDPTWMREAAESVLDPLSTSNLADWEKVLFFALATGQVSEAERIGEAAADEDGAFKKRWRVLREVAFFEESG
ncbi:MAG: serine/threonine-protein kinase [Verrucomicrobiales bacterium]|nr:serine/threonine-protein kinase [Verrucomicrobiales bacterium]